MKIRLTGTVEVHDAKSGEIITDAKRLRHLGGLTYEGDKCTEYLDEEQQLRIGLIGGTIGLLFDAKSESLLVVTDYASPKALKPKDVKWLIEETEGQWSDGIGAGIDDHWRASHNVVIDFFPMDRKSKTKCEQIDDGIEIKIPKASPLLSAAKSGNVATIQKLIEAGENVNARDRKGWSPLLLATCQQHLSAVIALVDAGANLDVNLRGVGTALHRACFDDETEIAKVLIAKGADVSIHDEGGNTPLMYATLHANRELVELLLARGADLNAPGSLGETGSANRETAFMYAKKDDLDFAAWLMDLGADPKVEDRHGNDAGAYAEWQGEGWGGKEKSNHKKWAAFVRSYKPKKRK